MMELVYANKVHINPHNQVERVFVAAEAVQPRLGRGQVWSRLCANVKVVLLHE